MYFDTVEKWLQSNDPDYGKQNGKEYPYMNLDRFNLVRRKETPVDPTSKQKQGWES